MNLQHYIILLIIPYFLNCQNSSGQEIKGGSVKFINEAKIIFYDADLRDTVQVSGVVRILFTDSTNLQPKRTEIAIFRMKGGVNFSYFYSSKNKLNDYEKILMKKYSAKVDSIFMNGKYQFQGGNKLIISNRLDFAFSFKILPKRH